MFNPDVISGRGGMFGGKGGADDAENSLRSRARAKLVEIIGEGPIKGLVNGERSIYFNETPLKNKNNTYNFEEVAWELHKGLPDDTHFRGNTTVQTPYTGPGVVKKDIGPVEVTISDANADSAKVVISIPALVRYNSEDGSMESTGLNYQIHVKPNVGPYVLVEDVILEDEKTSSSYQRSHMVSLPDDGAPWTIKVTRITDDSDSDKLINEFMFESYYTIVRGKFTYPHTAAIAISVDAEQVGSSMPSRAVHVDGLIVKVPSNYDPLTRVYTGTWNGTFKNEWTDNPAWVFYDLILSDRYGIGEFVKPSDVDKWSLYAVAQHCDQLVDTGYKTAGGAKIREPRYTFNAVINSRDEAFNVLRMVASTWRGMAYWSIGQVYATIDKQADPVKLLSPANVIDGEFKYSGVALKAKHTVVIVSWTDPDDFFRPAAEVIINDDMLKKYGWREKKVQLVGCTSRSMAARYGRWMLDVEQYADETVDYASGFDHADVKPGDIISIADPRKAQVRLGGRLASCTATHAILDFPFEPLLGETYTITMMRPDGITTVRGDGSSVTGPADVITRTIVSFDDEVFVEGVSVGFKRANFASIPSNIPVTNAMWVITGDVVPRQYRVIAMREEKKNIFRVTALFHDPNKYARIERNLELAPIQYTRREKYIAPPTNLHIVERHFLNDNDRIRSLINLSWSNSKTYSVKEYHITMLHPKKGRINLGWTDTLNIEIDNVVAGTYTFKVRARSYLGTTSEEAVIVYLASGSFGIPAPTVANLELAEKSSGTEFFGRDVEIQWKNMFASSSDPTVTGGTATENISTLYAHNVIKVYDADTDSLLREFKKRGNRYTYTFANNVEDNKAAARAPSRAVKFSVKVVDKLKRNSPEVFLTGTNYAPLTPAYTIRKRGASMRYKIEEPADHDLRGYRIWLSEITPFTPGPATLVHDGVSNIVDIPCKRGKQYYTVVAAYDAFGKTGLNMTAPLAIVAGINDYDDQDMAIPTNLTLTPTGDTDANGHVRSMIFANWDDNVEPWFDHYVLDINEGLNDYASHKLTKSKFRFRAKMGNTYSARVRAVDALGNKTDFTGFSSTVAVGDTVGPDIPTSLTATGLAKKVKLTWPECDAPDYKRTDIYRSATNSFTVAEAAGRIGSIAGTTYIDDDLTESTPVYYWIIHRDKSMNSSPRFPAAPTVANGQAATPTGFPAGTISPGTVTDEMTVTTLPDAPLTVSRARKVAIDEDGTVQLRMRVTWTIPVTLTVPIASYIVRVEGSDAAGEFSYFASDDLAAIIPVRAGVTYTVSVRSVAFNGRKSAFVVATPLLIAKKATADRAVTAPTSLNASQDLHRRIKLKFDACDDSDYKHTEIWRSTDATFGTASLDGVIKGNIYIDGELGNGVSRYYWVIHRDTSGNASARFPAGNGELGQTAQIVKADIKENAVETTEIKRGSVSGSSSLYVPYKQYIVKSSLNWSGNNNGTKYTETLTLATIKIDNQNPSPIAIVADLRMDIMPNGFSVGLGEGSYALTGMIWFEKKPPGGAWVIARQPFKVSDTTARGDSLKNLSIMENFAVTDIISNSLAGEWQYRVRMSLMHKRGDNDFTACVVKAGARINFTWNKR